MIEGMDRSTEVGLADRGGMRKQTGRRSEVEAEEEEMEDRLEMVSWWEVVVAGGSRHVELELRAFKSPAQR
jgi:hypothetical protein